MIQKKSFFQVVVMSVAPKLLILAVVYWLQKKLYWCLSYLSTVEAHVICLTTAFSPLTLIGTQANVFGIGAVGGIFAPLGQTKRIIFAFASWLLHRWLAFPHGQVLISTPVPYLSLVAPEKSYFEKWQDYTPIIDHRPYTWEWALKEQMQNKCSLPLVEQ